MPTYTHSKKLMEKWNQKIYLVPKKSNECILSSNLSLLNIHWGILLRLASVEGKGKDKQVGQSGGKKLNLQASPMTTSPDPVRATVAESARQGGFPVGHHGKPWRVWQLRLSWYNTSWIIWLNKLFLWRNSRHNSINQAIDKWTKNTHLQRVWLWFLVQKDDFWEKKI